MPSLPAGPGGPGGPTSPNDALGEKLGEKLGEIFVSTTGVFTWFEMFASTLVVTTFLESSVESDTFRLRL